MTFGPPSSLGNTYIPGYRHYALDDQELREALTRDYTSIANAVNLKTNGIFETVETQNGEQFFGTVTDQRKKRYVFRKSFTFGAVAAPGTTAITHGIIGITNTTRIYGTVITAIPDFRPIPHASVTANANIEVIVNSTTITINNGAGGPALTSGIVVLEYLKQ